MVSLDEERVHFTNLAESVESNLASFLQCDREEIKNQK